MTGGRCVGLCAFWALVAGCQATATDSRFTVRDSAGIRIVENVGVGEAPTAWTVPTETVFRVGWEEGEPALENVRAGFVRPHGDVVFGDGGSRLIRVVSSAGEVVSTFGGPGEGPGELGSIGRMIAASGDTVLVQEGSLGSARLSYFVDGEYVKGGTFRNLIEGGVYGLVGRASGGGYLVWATLGYMGRPGGFPAGWLRFPLLRAPADFSRFDTVAVLGVVSMPERGNLNPVRAAGRVATAGGLIVHALGDRPEVTWIDDEGNVRQIARWDTPPPPATEDDWSAYEARYREQYGDRYEPPELERRLAERRADFGGPLPYFDEAYGDAEGNVWLSAFDLGRDATGGASEYSVLAADGRWLGAVAFPREIRPLDITGDRFLGVERDDFDVQAVVLYRIEKPGG